MSHGRGPESLAVVLFDLDGCLLDSFEQHWRSLAAALADFDVESPPPSRIRELMGLPGIETVRTLGVPEVQAREVWERWIEWGTRLSHLPERFPGVNAMLERLRAAGYRLGVVTSRRRESVDNTPAAADLRSEVEVFVTRDQTEEGKPHPAPLLRALEALDVPPERAAYAGDAVYDVEASRRAGCVTILTTWDEADVDLPEDLEADFVAPSPEALTDWLLKTGGTA